MLKNNPYPVRDSADQSDRMRRTRLLPHTLISLALLVLSASSAAVAQARVGFEEVYSNVELTHPVDFDAGPHGHIYVTQQSGEVVRFSDRSSPGDREIFLDLTDRVL